MNRYEWKLEQRRERLEARAERLAREGAARVARGDQALSLIPLGQPILIGHHSEKRDRNYRNRAFGNISRGYELQKAASEAAAKAAAVGTGGISSDDPEAPDKLAEKLAKLKEVQARMVAANKIVRKYAGKNEAKGIAELAATGIGEAAAAALFRPDFAGRKGFADYQTKNNGANIRRIEARIAHLQRNATREPKETLHNSGVRMVENVEDNRLQLFFPGKPSAEVRTKLKQAGFRWAPGEGAWQRMLGNSAIWQAKNILEGLNG